MILHAAGLAVYLLTRPPVPPSPLVLQIELLPPAPSPPIQEEAAPSPAEAPPKPVPALPVKSPRPMASKPFHPLATTNEYAKPTFTKPSEKLQQQPTKPLEPVDEKQDAHFDAASVPASGAEKANNATLGDPSPSTRPAGPPPDYLGLIRGQLEKVKRYPASARAAGSEGTVMLGFVLSRTGELLSWKIVRPSGVAAFNEEVETMIRKAWFPPFPPSLDQDDLHLVVPVEFSLKDRGHR